MLEVLEARSAQAEPGSSEAFRGGLFLAVPATVAPGSPRSQQHSSNVCFHLPGLLPPFGSLPLHTVFSPLAPRCLTIPSINSFLSCNEDSPLLNRASSTLYKTLEHSSAKLFATLQQSLPSLGFPVNSCSFLSENCLEQPFTSIFHQRSVVIIYVLSKKMEAFSSAPHFSLLALSRITQNTCNLLTEPSWQSGLFLAVLQASPSLAYHAVPKAFLHF